MKEKSYVMVKPEFADNPEVVATVVKRLSDEGLEVNNGTYIHYTVEDARAHYAEHIGKEFYPPLEAYITGGVAYGMIVEGENAIARIRALAGATKNPAPGTIRYDIPTALGLEIRVRENVVHSSDGPESAEREIAIFENICKREKTKTGSQEV